MWHDVTQNTDEWLDLRKGKVTGSAISKVMANYGKAFGEPAKKYAVEIAVCQLTGKSSSNNYTNEHMERGHEQEPIARMLYEEQYFCEVTNGGFFDNGLTGDSPDGLVGSNGGVEIKSVLSSVQYERYRKQKYDTSYHWQLMFHLRETEREWFDYVSYCADFPEDKQLWTQRLYTEQHKQDFKQIDERLDQFHELVETIKQNING